MDYIFSDGLDKVIQLSKKEAFRLKSEFLSTEHLMLGIIETDNSAKDILMNLQADLVQIKRKIENMSVSNPNSLTNPVASISFTKMADQAIKRAELERRQYQSSEINTVHLLLAILFKHEDPITNVLAAYEIDYERATKEYRIMLKNLGQSPKMGAYDDDDERDEYEQMRKPL
ncbi:MAG: ATP-dependent Clp protease ATP-binding subunit, partial [Bacteroidetes bacterium]|nr:ATP-dependent Clp protease ATP-binding subunit [Bacteroidota bacterium]